MHKKNSRLRIAEIESGEGCGLLGVTFAPGKKQVGALSGNHDRDLGADLDVIADWNAAAIITLLEPHELAALHIDALGHEARRRMMEWHHLPIEDGNTPDAGFELGWEAESARLRGLLRNGANVLVHCKGGLGRAGMIAARLLVEMGVPCAEAMVQVRSARPGAIETRAQERWVARGERSNTPSAGAGQLDVLDRGQGALVGLAVGDAVGTTLEFEPKPAFARLSDMIGGGPFGLQPGQWTDDTAMALALADSLLASEDFAPRDLMMRFVDWSENGTYSCTGECFDIGNTVDDALQRFEATGDPLSGSTDPMSAGNGALMRLAPVAIRHWDDRSTLMKVAELQTRTTHGAAEAVFASRLFANMLADAIGGRRLPDILNDFADLGPLHPWRGTHRDEIRGSGYVMHSVQAAIWAVSRTTDFRSAILLAANLGEDADTTAAIAGQLAGAIYGLTGIPPEWRNRLAWHDRLMKTAERLLSANTSVNQGTALIPEVQKDE
ncbi:ADP-ribosylglycohydrolase family protein [Kaistia granuli]|uniref:ADP-ribosylglycohydrolase family protein n=1 Tax=Kaistia granuli TaxID=363259 RepID=UPI000363BD8B|nr:ADP-ribosylglycohydrolase family protein [Kaistia granuli]